MRQVDACDFCGDAPDGVFEVVPATVPDGPVRLALCGDCRATLETVVDPLLAADATDSAADEDSATDASRSESAESVADGDASTTTPDSDVAAETAPNTPTAMRESPEDGESDGTDDSDDESDDDDGITIEEQAGGTPAERPDGYAQVLRLLENRDGGMPREDLRALATNAYDLTDRTFEAAVDAAVENGDVEDGADGVRRT